LRAYGTAGAYVAHSTEVQAQAVFAGRLHTSDPGSWGFEPQDAWGLLHTDTGVATVPSERGAYQEYYTQFAVALRGDGPVPVPVDEAIATLELLDAARTSAVEGRSVTLPT